MSARALFFALLSNVCFMGLVASLYRPVWFRANGQVPSRWKIGGIWLALVVLCTALALNAGFRSSSEAERVPNVEVIHVEAVTDIVVPIDSVMADDRAMDAARAAEEPMDAAKEAFEPEPVAPSPAPSKPRPAARPGSRAPTPQR